MGKRGPPPTPTSELNRRGSWRGKTREGEPQGEVGLPPCPEWVSERVRHRWGEVGGMLVRMRVLTLADETALALLLEALASYLDADDLYEPTRLTVVSEKGVVSADPIVKIRGEAWDRVLKILREFGLTPSSRTAVTKIVEEDGNKGGKGRFFNPKVVG